MGLQMTLPSDKNHMATTFNDAYWAIVDLRYDFDTLTFRLACYPSRDAKQLNGKKVENPSIENYGSCEPTYKPELYSWTQILFIADVFPEGIPLGRNEQLKVLYSYIKNFTGLPFEDVFESDQMEEETEEEPMAQEEASDDPEEEDNFVNSEETETENKEQTEIPTEEEQSETEPQIEDESTEEETEDARS